jgi:hypothetical protein
MDKIYINYMFDQVINELKAVKMIYFLYRRK